MYFSPDSLSILFSAVMHAVAIGVFFGLLAYDALGAFLRILTRAASKFTKRSTRAELL